MSAEFVYLIMVMILFILAVSDLIVGVSNDAGNFLNSAIGSRAAKLRTIMIVAMIGIMVGAVFSSGMMEIARKGIFNPQYFYFRDVMIIFVVVMIVDVVLLNTFTSYGLPTSTTVSLIFELLGASVAVALAYNMRGNLIAVNESMIIGSVNDYINNKKSLEIIMGILLSIIIAFSAGALVQYVARIIFTFKYKKMLPYAGGIFTGLAFTSITYFMLIKGAKDASFMTDSAKAFVTNNSGKILWGCFIASTLVFQILVFIIKDWILRVTVLLGTFALAMAFAGNDLVNFIGVPIAGLNSYNAFSQSGGANPLAFSMEALSQDLPAQGWILAIAGVIMAITLSRSKKARTIMATTLDLARQQEGDEQFNSNYIARTIVRIGRNTGEAVNRYIPKRIQKKINKRFKKIKSGSAPDQAAFDLIRASVILVVASGLIAYATSYKLPLSTTYITFMTAMGASFADRSWSRESAVYRISGVLNVVGGWFLTAFAAFTAAFIVATIIFHAGTWATVIFILIALGAVYKTHLLHQKKVSIRDESKRLQAITSYSETDIIGQCIEIVQTHIIHISNMYDNTLNALFKEQRKQLSSLRKDSKQERSETQQLKQRLPDVLKKLEADAMLTSYNYVQIIENLNELAYTFNTITKYAFDHVDNNHKELNNNQIKDLSEFMRRKNVVIKTMLAGLLNPDALYMERMTNEHKLLSQYLDECLLKQIKRVKNGISGKKNSMLFMNIIAETKNLISFEMNMLRAHHQFMGKSSNQ